MPDDSSFLLRPDPAALTEQQQVRYLQMLLKGASPQVICQTVGVSATALFNTLKRQRSFAQQIELVHSLLSQNVAAALYRSALQGSTTAQQFYLKNMPPPEWPAHDASAGGNDSLDSLTYEELLRRCAESGIPLPAEAEELLGDGAAGDGSEPLPQADPHC